MAIWADLLISGVWFKQSNNSKYISDVMLHIDNGDSTGIGVKAGKDEVIRLLKNGTSICTMKWNYNSAVWSKGAAVTYETRNNINYLRTDPDASVTDNLDNLIDMTSFKFN